MLAPPGNSEADQYFETIPAPSGGRAPDTSKTVGDAVREGHLSPETARALLRRGELGEALATVVAQTAPPRVPSGPGAERGAGAEDGSRSPGATAAVPEEQGLGTLFPLLLVATAAAAAGYGVARWRGARGR